MAVTWSAIVSRLSIRTPRSRTVDITCMFADRNCTSVAVIFSSCWPEPSQISWVFCALRRSLLAFIQAPTSATQAVNWLLATSASTASELTYSWPCRCCRLCLFVVRICSLVTREFSRNSFKPVTGSDARNSPLLRLSLSLFRSWLIVGL